MFFTNYTHFVTVKI